MGTTCERCQGQGVIPRFHHVCRGICFRCWGTGEDLTQDIRGLAKWLDRARQEYASRSKALKAARDPKVQAALKKELDQLAKLGKANRRKFERLTAEVAYLRDRAREMSR